MEITARQAIFMVHGNRKPEAGSGSRGRKAEGGKSRVLMRLERLANLTHGGTFSGFPKAIFSAGVLGSPALEMLGVLASPCLAPSPSAKRWYH